MEAHRICTHHIKVNSMHISDKVSFLLVSRRHTTIQVVFYICYANHILCGYILVEARFATSSAAEAALGPITISQKTKEVYCCRLAPLLT